MDIRSEHNIVYTSCTEGGFEVLCNLLKANVPIEEIVSLTPEQGSKHRVSGYYPFADIADKYDIPVYYPDEYKMDNDTDQRHFEQIEADVIIVNGWQRLIPEEILRTSTRGALGVHGSAYGLPEGRGRSPMNWSLIEGLNRFLLSVINLDKGIDSGKIVKTKKYDITDFDTIRTLYYKLVMATTEMLDESLGPILEGEGEFDTQEGQPTYYPKRTPEDGGINWHDSTKNIYNLVRAVARPYPGAFTEHDGERIAIWEAVPFSYDFAFDAEPGAIVQLFVTTDEFVVKTSDGTLLVTEWESDFWTPAEGAILRSFGVPDRVDTSDH